MATGTSFQMDALQHVNESATQWKTCRCEEGDGEFCLVRKPENHDKQQQALTRCPKCQNLMVVKSGPLFISSKGLGWTSWKKRWFILTRASLVFFRSDPNAPIPRGSEVNLTLGGIELNNSGSVVVRADKKLLTVLFPDGRDGRAFTLKAETSEDMHEWKIAIESALSQAPSAALVMGGQNSIFQNDVVDTIENSLEQWKDRRAVKSTVIGRPILLALEDADGNPSFLEKALRFVEQYGVKVEGILRQSADVEEVERRVEEYEQGKNEFSPDEDAHVIGDCIKHILRELPSSPVPASCCTALLEAFRGDRGARISSMHGVILETFPEPNRRLLQRILQMMQIIASHKSENRMSVSAVAACMAPLLLRPLLAGDCELEDDFDMGGDGSIQLLQAAAAANHAQAIVINLLEQYERIFTDEHLQEDSFSSELYSDSEGSEDDYEYEDEDSTDDEIEQDNSYHDVEDDINHNTEDDPERMSSGRHDGSGSDFGSDLYGNKAVDCHDSSYAPSKVSDNSEATERLADVVRHDSQVQHVTSQESSSSEPTVLPQNTALNNGNCLPDETDSCLAIEISDPHESSGEFPTHVNPIVRSVSETISGNIKLIDKPASSIKRTAVWGRTSARKNLSMETIDYVSDDEAAVQKLEVTKSDLQSKVTKEVKENELLQASLERRKEALCNRRLALQQDVERLQLQLQKERALRAYLEAGYTQPGLPISAAVDSKTRRNLEEITLAEADIMSLKQKVTDLQGQLNQPEQQISESPHESCSQRLYASDQSNNCSSREMNNAEAYKDDNGQTSQNCDSTQSDRKDEPEENIIKIAPRSHEKSRSNEFHDSPTFQHKHPPRRKNHNIRSTKSSHDGPTDAGNATIKKTSVRGEDVVSASSSALTRLTNRLNFLKERRVQLVNEIQAADTTHSQYSKGPPPRTNSS